MSDTRTEIVERLREAGSTGADLSPGDPLCLEAADLIEALEAELATYGKDVMWQCFGCGLEFADSEYEDAAEHFGMAGEKPNPACVENLRALKAEIARLRDALAFAQSCIRSGERWTKTCERVIGGALLTGTEAGEGA